MAPDADHPGSTDGFETALSGRVSTGHAWQLFVPHGVVVLPTGELAIVDAQEGAVLLGHL